MYPSFMSLLRKFRSGSGVRCRSDKSELRDSSVPFLFLSVETCRRLTKRHEELVAVILEQGSHTEHSHTHSLLLALFLRVGSIKVLYPSRAQRIVPFSDAFSCPSSNDITYVYTAVHVPPLIIHYRIFCNGGSGPLEADMPSEHWK